MKMQSRFGLVLLVSGLVGSPAGAVTLTVLGNANPNLAGRADGYACCSGDSVPTQAPAQVVGLAFSAGDTLVFSATGGVSVTPSVPSSNTPDGVSAFSMTNYGDGISAPTSVRVSALMGIVPLDDKSHGDLADEVMGSVTGWVTSHYQRDGLPVPVASDVAEITRRRDDPLQVKDVQLESGEFHRALFWTHPASNGANYYWSTLCDLAFADERFDFQFVLGVESNDYSCVPGDLRPARPRLIAYLLGNPHWRCVSGGVELPMFPRTLTVHEVDEFCTLLYAGNRTVPVVVMSPRLGPRRVYPVEPRLLAERLAGTARVAVLCDSGP